ncbi:MAG: HD domain-containing protein [Bacteroidales bacterium]|nr:HD domain-containing protein [Bacteroidales bacterium]
MSTIRQDGIPEALVSYIESEIIPAYDNFDSAHGREHVRHVIDEALKLCRHYDVDEAIVYTAAAFHDTGLVKDRKTHHIESARIIREDPRLREWFNDNEIETMAEAAEDHRASSVHEPRSIYGKLIAEADRQIVPETVIRRCIQFGLEHCPGLDMEAQYERATAHLEEKYGEGGYLRLWIPESENALRLNELRAIIKDIPRLREIFGRIYGEEVCRNLR